MHPAIFHYCANNNKMKNFLTEYPDRKTLLQLFPKTEILKVNSHVHSPYSFSAFTGIPQIFEMAVKENIAVVGINDFFVTDGYVPFYQEAMKTGVFPLFNIEFIGLLKKEQQLNIRINDPNNPGRCYFSGKGLDYPFSAGGRFREKLSRIVAESQDQVRAMIKKANEWFGQVNAGIILDYQEIRKNFAKELVRERHIAKAIRIAVFDRFSADTERIALLTSVFGGKAPTSALIDIPGLENEIRGNLLKAGGKAFVEEDDNAFLNIDEVIEIIVNAGGIPCYPVLLDDKSGNYTGYEKDTETLYKELTDRNIWCLELIPGRNDTGHFEKFVRYFHNKGFVILLGTEHNAPDMIPLTCNTRGNNPLSSEIVRISYEGACVVAAHQYLHAKDQAGYVDKPGKSQCLARELFIELGNAVIHFYRKQLKKEN
jgi:hypothetical protein